MKIVKAKKVIVVILSIFLVSMLFAGCGGGGGNNGSSGSNQKPTTANITVVVVDDSGNTVPGATVSIDSTSGTTDANGNYVFKSVKEGSYTIKATKDGYEDAQKDITVSAGNDQTVTLTLKKKQEQVSALPVKDPFKVKSFRMIITTTSEDENGKEKVVMEQDDYGKKQRFIAYNSDGKKTLEVIVVGDKAKVWQNGKWMSMPSSMVKALTSGSMQSYIIMQNDIYMAYNGWVKDPTGQFSYKVEREKQETVNGYSTTKYLISGKEKTENGVVVGNAAIWVINKGDYKGYVTRLVIDEKDSSGEKHVLRVDTLDFGKDMNISLP